MRRWTAREERNASRSADNRRTVQPCEGRMAERVFGEGREKVEG